MPGQRSARSSSDSSRSSVGPIGFEYNSIRDDDVRKWFQAKSEKEWVTYGPSVDEKKAILSKTHGCRSL